MFEVTKCRIDYAYEDAQVNYLTEGGRSRGEWLSNNASKALGLSGGVQRDHLRSIGKRLHPKTAVPLGQRQSFKKGERKARTGYDGVFSPPKHVDVIWAVSPEHVRKRLAEEHRRAVKEALSVFAEKGSHVRFGKGGAGLMRATPLVALFDHHTNRANEPKLHTHCTFAPVALSEDGVWRSLRSRDLFYWKMTLGALYQAACARRLGEMGLPIKQEDVAFSIPGVQKDLCDKWSSRRRAVENEVGACGGYTAREAQIAALRTRPKKRHVPLEELLPKWRAEALEFGFSEANAERLFRATVARERALAPEALSEAAAELDLDGMERVTEARLLRKVIDKVRVDSVPLDEVVSKVERYLASSKELVPLGLNKHHYRTYTTVDLYRSEQSLLEASKALSDAPTHGVTPRVLGDVLQRYGLSAEQESAVRHLTAPGGLSLVAGYAGTGKTYMMACARSAWERSGYKVIGTALSARAARELMNGSGIESSTTASLLHRLDPSASFTSKTVLVIDEASMVDTRSLETLLKGAARRGAKVVLAGDSSQLQALFDGGGFKSLIERFGAAQLRNIKRQRSRWMRAAVYDFAHGDAKTALGRYAAQGFLHVDTTREVSLKHLVSAWTRERTADLSQTLVLAGTNKEVDALNTLIQRKRSSELGRGFECRDKVFYEGDRVTFTVNQRNLGVINGDFGTVERVDGPRIYVRLDRTEPSPEGVRHLRLALRAKDLTVKAFGERRELMRLGYATTVHKAQGATVDRAFVLAGGWLQDQELAYVQMSRAREHCRIFADEHTAGEGLTDLIRTMERSRKKELAHDAEQAHVQRFALGV